ncbi:MAG: TolC family protein [Segetibacter sp.]|jgi:outer membrane protein|nr:TolC family protein [Segetibacter sp.]
MIKQGAIKLLFLFITLHCYGQQQFTLDECYRLALDRNINLKQAQNNIKGNAIDHRTAQYRLLPSVSYNLGHYFSFGKNIDPVTNTFVYESFSGGYTAFGLQMQLFSGFSRLNAIKQSAYNIEASEYAKKRAELELLTNITLIYARLLLDKEQLSIERNNIESTTKELEIINEKIKVGRLTKYEYYTFNARLNTEQANLVSLQNDSLAALQDLKQLLNIQYKEKLDIAAIDTSVLSIIYTSNISSEDYIETILQKHPAIKQAQMDELVARLGEKIARGSFYPSLSVGGNLNSNYNANRTMQNGRKIPIDRQLNDNLGQNININLRIPIFSQLENASRVKRERINISNAELAIQEAQNTVVTNTLQLVNDFNASRQKYMATLTAWEQNKLSYNLYEEKYRLGQISSVELLAARDILNTSTSGYLQARLQLYFQFQVMELLKRY